MVLERFRLDGKVAVVTGAGGGTLKIRDLLRETRRLGFKSDQGGLHTYLKSLEEFIQSGRGEFSLRIDAERDMPPDAAESMKDTTP